MLQNYSLFKTFIANHPFFFRLLKDTLEYMHAGSNKNGPKVPVEKKIVKKKKKKNMRKQNTRPGHTDAASQRFPNKQTLTPSTPPKTKRFETNIHGYHTKSPRDNHSLPEKQNKDTDYRKIDKDVGKGKDMQISLLQAYILKDKVKQN